MPREEFTHQLRNLEDDLLFIGSMVEKALDGAVEALVHRDGVMAERVVQDDLKIDAARYRVEDQCLLLLATQQPMAKDLRAIAGMLTIASELERMGDYAEGIAKISLRLAEEPPIRALSQISSMAAKCQHLLHMVLEALVYRDVAIARQISKSEDEVDAMYERAFDELLAYMVADPQAITRGTYLLWVAHNLERIADRVTNVAERIIFIVTGEMERVNLAVPS